MLLHASRQNVVARVQRSCAADMLVTRSCTTSVIAGCSGSSQVERSMGGGSSALHASRKHVLTRGELCCRAYMMVLDGRIVARQNRNA